MSMPGKAHEGQDGGAAVPLRCACIAAEEPGAIVLRVKEPASALGLLLSLGASKQAAKRIFSEGRLSSDGERLAPQSRLSAGREVWLEDPPMGAAGADPAAAAQLPAKILYEDRFCLVADKPSGILVHSDGTGLRKDTLASRVAAHLEEEGRPCRAQAVQRLDVETNGCTLFSLDPDFQAGFDALAAGHTMQKLYLAAVRGSLPGELVVEAPLGRDRHDAQRMRVSASGKEAKSHIWCLAKAHGLSLALVQLETGRRHQIRVHLATRGFPIVGDALYGEGGAPSGPHPGRVCLSGCGTAELGLQLHCWREGFVHPVMGEKVLATSPVPESFCQLFGGTAIQRALARWADAHAS